jgi:hypothetical protein
MAGRSTRSLAIMRTRFNFWHRGLLSLLAVALAVSSALTYAFEMGQVMLVVGFFLFMLGAYLPRARAGNPISFSYPPPTQAEGSIAALGLSLMLGVTIAAVAQQVFQG